MSKRQPMTEPDHPTLREGELRAIELNLARLLAQHLQAEYDRFPRSSMVPSVACFLDTDRCLRVNWRTVYLWQADPTNRRRLANPVQVSGPYTVRRLTPILQARHWSPARPIRGKRYMVAPRSFLDLVVDFLDSTTFWIPPFLAPPAPEA